ncbi:MAG: VWA domain-containing protein, partial [Desulfitobacterium hafniense]|nr:VWA domain-containing protein [Desulfitobacterium hafniense]
MKTNITELVFILDKSGSMSGLESDTIGGFNAMVSKQQKEPGEAIVTTVLFDDNYELLHDRISIKGIRPITEKEYYVGGCTALLDAIGKTIQKISNVQKQTSEDQRADKVVLVITTDGMENASREYTADSIKKMIERQKEKYDWEFIFLGANIDAIATAAKV